MGISAGNKKMVGGHFISDIIDSDVLKILLGTREVFSAQPTPKARLPHEYQEVKWISSSSSSGTSGEYIDTGFKPNNNSRYVVDYMKLQQNSAPIGCFNNSTNYGFVINDGGPHYGTQASNNIIYDSSYTNKRMFCDLNKNLFYVDGVLKATLNTQTFQMDINTWLFAWNRNGALSNNYGTRIYSAKIYDNDTLVRDFVPCYRVSDGAAGLYDLVEGKFYGNSGTGAFKRGASVNVWEMPSGYTELAYIESSGTQWVDTGLYWELNKKFILDSKRSSTLSYGLVFGANSSGGEQLYVRDQNRIYLNGSVVNGVSAPSSNVRHIIEWNTTSGNAYIKLDGATVASSSGTSTNNKKLTLFGTYETSNAQTPTGYKTKIYSFKGYDVSNNKLLRDFVPCVRDSDGVIGMYDLITKQFFTNSGSGDFVAGPIIMRDKFKPTENTIAYYEFNGDLIDSSGNNRNLSVYTGSFSYGTTSGGAKYIQTSSSNTANNLTIPINFDGYTVSCFVSFGELRSTGAQGIILDIQSNDGFPRFRTGNGGINSYCGGSNRASASTDTRYHLVCVIKNKVLYCYINGELKFQDNVADYSGTTATLVLNGISDKSRTQYRMSGKMSELIIEKQGRTQESITKYFNKMKNLYGIS